MLRKRPRAGQYNPGTVHEDGRVEPPIGRRYVPACGASVAYSHKWFRHRQVYLKTEGCLPLSPSLQTADGKSVAASQG